MTEADARPAAQSATLRIEPTARGLKAWVPRTPRELPPAVVPTLLALIVLAAGAAVLATAFLPVVEALVAVLLFLLLLLPFFWHGVISRLPRSLDGGALELSGGQLSIRRRPGSPAQVWPADQIVDVAVDLSEPEAGDGELRCPVYLLIVLHGRATLRLFIRPFDPGLVRLAEALRSALNLPRREELSREFLSQRVALSAGRGQPAPGTALVLPYEQGAAERLICNYRERGLSIQLTEAAIYEAASLGRPWIALREGMLTIHHDLWQGQWPAEGVLAVRAFDSALVLLVETGRLVRVPLPIRPGECQWIADTLCRALGLPTA